MILIIVIDFPMLHVHVIAMTAAFSFCLFVLLPRHHATAVLMVVIDEVMPSAVVTVMRMGLHHVRVILISATVLLV